MGYKIETLISEEDLKERIQAVGKAISRDYAGKTVHLICVLKGGAYFMTELSKYIEVPVTIDFMAISSYGSGTISKGVVKIIKDLDEPIEGRDVIVVEDIVDSGHTLSYLLNLLKDRHPATIRLATLLDKPDRRVVQVHVDYCCAIVPDKFIVGYGLDYDQKFRNLPYIGAIEGL